MNPVAGGLNQVGSGQAERNYWAADFKQDCGQAINSGAWLRTK
jgi:hypothetical protein